MVEFENDYNFTEVLINKYFDLPPIKGLTKTFIDKNKGEVPVYGGKKVKEPIGYISENLDNVKYFSNCLGWNREGSVGYVFKHDNKFTTNDHHRPLILKKQFNDEIDLNYARYSIENTLLSQGFKWSKTASKEKVAKLTFKLPVNKDGIVDFNLQKEISLKLHKIENIKKVIINELERIENIEIDFLAG